jgi:uncharacterized protein (UPF0332 family)
MFNAARAALVKIGAPPNVIRAKTHSGLHANFNLFLIKPKVLPESLGEDLRAAETMRLVSDYLGDLISNTQAEDMLRRSSHFVASIENWLAEN